MNRFAKSLQLLVPLLGVLVVAGTLGRDLLNAWGVAVGVVQVAMVILAVMHAEAIAHKVGEPFGTLILAVAVTVIEVSLIVTLMMSEGDKAAALARDTVFAAIMIVCNGVVGLSLLLGARRRDHVHFSEQGANALLGTLFTLATLSLVMPTFTSSSNGATFNGPQLAFAAVASIVVYGIFVFVQTVRHRWMFLSPEAMAEEERSTLAHVRPAHGAETVHIGPMWMRLAGLLLSLVAVVGLAKQLADPIERGVELLGAPDSFVGVVIALMVLLPESIAACRASSRGEMQTSLNLAIGSALASIGLTVPAIAVASVWIDGPVTLGLGGKEIVLLTLTAAISILTFGSGRATVLQATHHLAVFSAFMFLAVVP